MSVPQDLTGKRFGRLTCIKIVGRDSQYRRKWLCTCTCGNETIVIASSLKNGLTKSCGCLGRERRSMVNTTHAHLVGKRTNTPRLYSIWRNMKQRCLNPNASKFENYGGRGIQVCEEWLEYASFHNWAINNGYEENLTLDRKECDGNYEPANCRWVSYSAQNSNKRDNRLIEFNGDKKTLMEWSRILGIKYSTLNARLNQYYWTVEKAFNKPVKEKKHEIKTNETDPKEFQRD